MSLEDRQEAMRKRSWKAKNGRAAKLRKKIIRQATTYPRMSWEMVAFFARSKRVFDGIGNSRSYGLETDVTEQYVAQVMKEAGYYKRRVVEKGKDADGKEVNHVYYITTKVETI